MSAADAAFLVVEKGRPTDEELAAVLVAVLDVLVDATAAAAEPPRPRRGPRATRSRLGGFVPPCSWAA